MHDERDILSRRVFPRLRERFAADRATICEIDLRWGVTEALARNQGAVDVCLDEIERCTPLVLGMVGHRAGWVPALVSSRVERERMLLGRALFGFLREPGNNNWSMTEIELRFALALAVARRLSPPLVFFRAESLTCALTGNDSAPREAGFDVHRRIRAFVPASSCVDYETLEGFEQTSELRLATLLESFLASPAPRATPAPAPAAPRKKVLAVIAELGTRRVPVVVTGPTGVGASWVLKQHVGDGPGLLLDGRRSTVDEITDSLARVGAGSSSARVRLAEAMAILPPGRYVIDHYDDAFGAPERADLGALAPKLPPGVEFVVMLRAPRLLQKARLRALPVVEIPPLDTDERARFIVAFLRAYGKTLEPSQATRLATSAWAPRIGAIVLSLHELRRFGTYEALSARIDELSRLENDEALAAEVLRGLRAVLPAELRDRLKPSLAAIMLSLRGLEDSLVYDILAPGDAGAPRYWSALRVSMGDALGQAHGRTVLSSGPIQDFLRGELKATRSLAVDATRALQEALADLSPGRSVEEAPRIALVQGGDAALAELFADTECAVRMIELGRAFTEGWLNMLGPDLKREVCSRWITAARQRNAVDTWLLTELAASIGCTDEALVLLSIDAERLPHRPGRIALQAFLQPLPENLSALDSELERSTKVGAPFEADDVAAALTLLDASSDGRMTLSQRRMIELEDAVCRSAAFAVSPSIQAHLATTTGQRALLQAAWDAAFAAFDRAAHIARQAGDVQRLCRALERLAAVAPELRRFRAGRLAAGECLELSQSAGLLVFESLAFERLIEIEKRCANWPDAYAHAEAYIRRVQEASGDVTRARRALDGISET